MKHILRKAFVCAMALSSFTVAAQAELQCGQYYSVVRGDTLTHIGKRAYASPLYQPIYNVNVDTIGSNPDLILIGQSLMIPCLTAQGTLVEDTEVAATEGQLVFTFNKASAPPFIMNSGIIDKYLAEITAVTEGRVTFVDPEVVNRDHGAQFELVTSGQVDGAYILNSTIAASHPLLQLPMKPMFGGSAEQTAVSLWRLHDKYLAKTDYFPEAELLGFVAAPAAHIWRDADAPVTASENVAKKNTYHVPYFEGLDTRGPAAMRADFAALSSSFDAEPAPAAFFMAHGAAIAVGAWSEGSNVSVMEVDNGLYTPTFSVVLSNAAWDQISDADQAAIRAISGEKLARRSAEWDAFDNAFRSRMLKLGLKFEKADRKLTDNLWMSSFNELNAWIEYAEARDVPGVDAVNFYLESLRSLQDRLMYRGDETFVDQHPFVTVGN